MTMSTPLHQRLTDEVLETIAEAARSYGHLGDHVEVVEFVKWCHSLTGKDAPDMEPHED